MLYEVITAYDQAGASIALDVAREHGLPEEILRRAEQNLLMEGGDSSKVLTRLNELAVEREQEVVITSYSIHYTKLYDWSRPGS